MHDDVLRACIHTGKINRPCLVFRMHHACALHGLRNFEGDFKELMGSPHWLIHFKAQGQEGYFMKVSDSHAGTFPQLIIIGCVGLLSIRIVDIMSEAIEML